MDVSRSITDPFEFYSLSLQTYCLLIIIDDWRTRLTTADGSSLELDPDLLQDTDDVDTSRIRQRHRVFKNNIAAEFFFY